MNNDHINDPTNRNIPKITNEKIIIEKFVFSLKLSKNPYELSFLLTGLIKLHPHSVQNSISSSEISFPQLGQNFKLTIIYTLLIIYY